MVKYKFKKGKKSPNDRIIIVDSNNEAWSFINVAYTLALIVKNEQTISGEISHYLRGSDLIKEYVMKIFNKNWIIVPDDRIMKELNTIYHGDKKNQTSNLDYFIDNIK